MRSGRFGPYVNHGKVNATLPRGVNPETLTMEAAVAALAAKAAGIVPGARALGEHPEGGPVTVRAGRFGPYVNWGKVNANIPKSMAPDSVTLDDALRWLAEREGKPVKATAARRKAEPQDESSAPAKKTAARTARRNKKA